MESAALGAPPMRQQHDARDGTIQPHPGWAIPSSRTSEAQRIVRPPSGVTWHLWCKIKAQGASRYNSSSLSSCTVRRLVTSSFHLGGQRGTLRHHAREQRHRRWWRHRQHGLQVSSTASPNTGQSRVSLSPVFWSVTSTTEPSPTLTRCGSRPPSMDVLLQALRATRAAPARTAGAPARPCIRCFPGGRPSRRRAGSRQASVELVLERLDLVPQFLLERFEHVNPVRLKKKFDARLCNRAPRVPPSSYPMHEHEANVTGGA